MRNGRDCESRPSLPQRYFQGVFVMAHAVSPIRPGYVYEKWTVIGFCGRDPSTGRQLLKMRCKCGTEKVSPKNQLRVSKSCRRCARTGEPGIPHRIHIRNRRKRLKASGLCVACGELASGGRLQCQKCLLKTNASGRSTYERRKLLKICHVCSKPVKNGRTVCIPCAKRHSQKAAKRRLEIKLRVLGEYGGRCICCGERNLEFLTIDHINNDGAQHRKKIGNAGAVYKWIISHDFPKDFQVLCFNCNFSKAVYGYCPHRRDVILNDKPRSIHALSDVRSCAPIFASSE